MKLNPHHNPVYMPESKILSPRVRKFLEKVLSWDRKKRFQTAEEMLGEFGSVIRQVDKVRVKRIQYKTTKPVSKVSQSRLTKHKRSSLWLIFTALNIIMVIFLFLSIYPHEDSGNLQDIEATSRRSTKHKSQQTMEIETTIDAIGNQIDINVGVGEVDGIDKRYGSFEVNSMDHSLSDQLKERQKIANAYLRPQPRPKVTSTLPPPIGGNVIMGGLIKRSHLINWKRQRHY